MGLPGLPSPVRRTLIARRARAGRVSSRDMALAVEGDCRAAQKINYRLLTRAVNRSARSQRDS
jgi:hypothetical protein